MSMTHKHFKGLNINNENRANLFVFFIFIFFIIFESLSIILTIRKINIINDTMLEYLDLKVTENILELLVLKESLLIYLFLEFYMAFQRNESYSNISTNFLWKKVKKLNFGSKSINSSSFCVVKFSLPRIRELLILQKQKLISSIPISNAFTDS